MLNTTPQMQFSPYIALYDMVVPKDNKFRRAHDLIDFSFLYDELKMKYCKNNGRMAVDPVRLFKYLVAKVVLDMSDVGIVERSRTDLALKYFLDMLPEEDVIDPSALTKFRKLRLNDEGLMDKLLCKSVEIAQELGIIKGRTIIVDSTHSCSRSNPMAPIALLRRRCQELRHAMRGLFKEAEANLPAAPKVEDLGHHMDYCSKLVDIVADNDVFTISPAIQDKMWLLREAIDDIADHYTSAPQEPDARVGHKSADSAFYGFKTHEAVTPGGIIVAAKVTSGEAPDGPQLEELVEQSRAHGMEVDMVIGDAAYSGDANLKLAADEDKGFTLVSKVNPMLQGGHLESDDGFTYNKDANTCVCPAGHLAVSTRVVAYRPGKGNQRAVFRFDKAKCAVCSRRAECLGKSATKTYSVSIRTPEQEAQIAFQQTEAFQRLARQRYKVEQCFVHQKNIYGYSRAKSYGINNMRMQAAVTLFVANIQKIIKLTS